jgi:hypothetical protein
MIKTRVYKLKGEQDKNGKIKYKSELYAELRFKDEIAPNKRDEIKKRINNKSESSPISEYLGKFESMRKNSIGGEYYRFGSDWEINIKEHKSLRLGLDITIKADDNLKIEQFLDLEKLNKFILTGEK